MALTDAEFEAANRAAAKAGPRPLSARYDRRSKKIVVALDTGIDVAFRPDEAQGLAGASPEDLAAVTVSPLGLHWRGSTPTFPSPAFWPGGSARRVGWRR